MRKPTPYQKQYEDEEQTETQSTDSPTPKDQAPDANGSPDDADRDDDIGQNSEEESWKKRHGKLRSSFQKKESRYKTEIEELQRKLRAAQEQSTGLPVNLSAEQLQKWISENPQSAAVVRMMAQKIAKEEVAQTASHLEELRAKQYELDIAKAEHELSKRHPDFDSIRESDEFHAWAETLSASQKEDLYGEDYDPDAVSRILDFYKAETGYGKPKKKASKQDDAAASRSVKTPQTSVNPDRDPNGGKRVWKESEIEKLSPAEWDANEQDIIAASIEGRLIRDLYNK